MSILNLLASNNYFIYNKTLAKTLSVEAAILLGYYANQYSYYERTNQLEEIEGKLYFYATRDSIYDETGLSDSISRKADKLLLDNNIIEIHKIGIPAKNYYTVNENELDKFLKNKISSDLKIKPLVVENLNSNNNKLNSNKTNNNISNINIRNTADSDNSKKSPFNKDKLNNDIELPIRTKKQKQDIILDENIKCIIDYLNESIKSRYKYNSKTTVKLIAQRFKDGYKLDDFYDVIDYKTKEWLNTDFQKFLRPETLFGDKFENYLNSSKFKGAPKVSYGSKPTFDNTSNHIVPKGVASMNAEERKEFENKLAKKSDGTLWTF